MHIPTHALLGWLVAEAANLESKRDRALVFAAGLVPDLDGLTILGGAEVFQTWHHVLLHHVTGAVGYAVVAGLCAQRKLKVAAWALFGFHLHLLCDFVGSAGPDGSGWSIPYFVPFDFADYYCPFQWGLASWQNVSITLAALVVIAVLGVRRQRTFLEVVWPRADAAVVEVLQRRFGRPAPDDPAPNDPAED